MQKTAHRMTTAHRTYGFTLVEISVVFVIIGLIIGGIFMGNDMIKSSQLRGVLKDIEQFNAATNTFQEKYNALPGDMPNATDYWGENSGICYYAGSTPNYNQATTTSTCNGNGDGMIGGEGLKTAVLTTTDMNEPIFFWRHLQNAGLINCNCSGQSILSYGRTIPGYNSPLSPLGNGSGYGVGDGSSYLFQFQAYQMTGHHYFTIGVLPDQPYLPINPVMTANEAYNIDLKIDDGIPSTGIVMTTTYHYYPAHTDVCATSATVSLAKYNTSTPGIICALFFQASF